MPEKNSLSQKISRRWVGQGYGHGIMALVLGGFFLGLLLWTTLAADEIRWDRIFGIGLVFFILALALFDNLFEMLDKVRFWSKLARRAGLECRVGSFFLGYPVEVSGLYRRRPLTLHTFKRGKGQVASTQIELSVNNPINASLRLRGPFKRDETASDKITTDLFSATDARQFGDDQRFFIRGHPVHLVTGIFRTGPLRNKLLELKPLVSIELEGQKLVFEQLGVLKDVDYLQFLFDLLSDLADTIDHGGYLKLVSSSSSQAG